ncbi:DNA-processing protein DprA [Paraflavitalea sp. CAU 1676]|uniref:DNA-processing protein DprA n=1 Tax=Paraflavitalea sp. CAU 1676 TaxID=3032598 RepID=UPI0023DCD946|nr:DNA-processing protein DprA [Paraflavitalea sp. CAU 1676]MDF2192239.1 DNA-processing protein DprA [Paraflavitalea sp. CAU 1676]
MVIVHAMKNELQYQLAIASVQHIGPIHAKTLAEQFGSATAIFKASTAQLERVEGIGPMRAAAIRSFDAFHELEKEMRFIEKFNIRPLFLTDPQYPQRLLNCCDAPTLLYYKGEADLNSSRILSIIGTRSNTEYGKYLTENLVKELAPYEVLIISGLAFGIDALAHKAALKNQLPTVGVLAHGLDTLYPSQHKQLAREMVAEGGGLLTEFMSETKPDKHNFPARNRIVAGMSDAIIVVETGVKGGSMITAELANSYNKDVFAFPGKTTDPKSAGANELIRSNKAMLITEAQQLINIMGWANHPKKAPVQQQLYITLNPAEQQLANLLSQKEMVHIDELNLRSGLSSSTIAAALLNLELQGVIQNLPGKRYKLLASISMNESSYQP